MSQFDATDMDMIRAGDMLGPKLGARVADALSAREPLPITTPAMSDLVERLRARVEESKQLLSPAITDSSASNAALLSEAADAIEAKDAAIAGLEAERDKLQEVVRELDRLGLVIEAGVRWSDPRNLPQIHNLLAMEGVKDAAAARRAVLHPTEADHG